MAHPNPFFNGTLGCTLHYRTIGHRVGKGYTELNNVGAGRNKRVHERNRCLWRGVTCRDVGDKRRPPLRFREGRCQTIGLGLCYLTHNLIPLISATVCISLSPLPDKFTKIILSFDNVGASLTACAMAWEDSSAGMMPSVRQHL